MNQNIMNWFRLILLSLIWGSSFILMKRGMIHKPSEEFIFDNNQVAALRMFIAALIIMPFALKHLDILMKKQNILPLLIVGFLGNFVPAFLFTYAETSITSGLAGMLNSCTPIFTVIIGILVFKQPFIKLQAVGILIGTIGMFTLVGSGDLFSAETKIIAILAVVLATLFYATSLNTIKHRLGHIKPLTITSLGFLTTLPISLFLLFQLDVSSTIKTSDHSVYGLSHIAILGVIGTSISVMIFTRLIADTSAIFASSVTYFIPIVAAVIGFLDGEVLNLYQILGMLLILAGVYTINVIGRRRKLKIAQQDSIKN